MNDILKKIDTEKTIHLLIAGDEGEKAAIEAALLYHLPLYEKDSRRRTRISLLFETLTKAEDFIFEYKELFDNSFYRIVRLDHDKVETTLHRPVYHGLRKEFVDVEWELIIGRLSNPVLQEKMLKWSFDSERQLIVLLCYNDDDRNARYAEKISRRLAPDTVVTVSKQDPREEEKREKEFLPMAKYLNYCYKKSFEEGKIPAELPEDEVEEAWNELPDDRMRKSSLQNVMAIPFKMLILGHDRNDWDKFYALTAAEIERLTAVEHNRWSVERLIQGVRPCTDRERNEIEEDFRRRREDNEYARANPLTLKKRYARERGAHFDLCAFSELGVDETGLSVVRYDRLLTEAIPLIVKTYIDRHHG